MEQPRDKFAHQRGHFHQQLRNVFGGHARAATISIRLEFFKQIWVFLLGGAIKNQGQIAQSARIVKISVVEAGNAQSRQWVVIFKMAFHPFLQSFREIARQAQAKIYDKFIGLRAGMREPEQIQSTYQNLLLLK